MSDQIVLGIVGIKNCGIYDANKTYEKLNVVTYNGSTYCALKETKGNLPTNTDYWQLYAEKGEKGDTGLTGPRGPRGFKGDPSGSPLFASSVSTMTDTTKIYVNTTDGYWYYYNGTSWTQGGIYQATSDTKQVENQVDNNENFVYAYTKDFTIGRAFNLSNDTVPEWTYASVNSSIEIECEEGDTFEILGGSGDGTARVYAFIDENRTILEKSGATVNDNIIQSKRILTAPRNATTLICNFNFDNYVCRLIRYTRHLKDIDDLKEEIDSANINIEELENEIENQKNNPYNNYNYIGNAENNRLTMIGTSSDTIGSSYSSNNHKTIEIECEEGDTFEIKGSVEASPRLWGFIDENRKRLDRASSLAIDNTRYDNPIRILAPKNAKKLICNFLVEGYPDSYVIKLNNMGYDTSSYKYVMPKWAEIFDFEEIPYTASQNNYTFEQFYDLFHELTTSYNGLEEIKMDEEYLTNNQDEIPSNITNLRNGGLYLYHLLPREEDGSNYTVKHKKLKLLITGGIHGGEKKSIWNLYHLLKNLVSNDPQSRALSIIRNFCDLYVIPLSCPSGIQNNTRVNANNVNINRDFEVNGWVSTSDSGETFNSQYETRCISWWVKEKIKPNSSIDHHTSSGDSQSERGKFVQWGWSTIPSVNSLIEENIMEITQEIKNRYSEKFVDYNHVFGHTEDFTNTSKRYGIFSIFCGQNDIISCTYEVVQHVKWDGKFIFGYSDSDESAIMTIDYQGFINFLLKFMQESINLLNNNIVIR